MGIRLYHLSMKPNLSAMVPRIPRSAAQLENKNIKRISFAPSISSALSALPIVPIGKILYVYQAMSVDPKFVYKPTRKEVPDVGLTHEIWYLAPVTVKKVAVIIVGDPFKRRVLVSPENMAETWSVYNWNYKRFKNRPTTRERQEYFASQPTTTKVLESIRKEREERKQQALQSQNESAVKKTLKKVFNLPVFSLIGSKLKQIV
jgi:hypothetical protein